jgi:hypothetical protein
MNLTRKTIINVKTGNPVTRKEVAARFNKRTTPAPTSEIDQRLKRRIPMAIGYIVQGRDHNGKWAKPKVFCHLYTTRDDAERMRDDLDQHGNDARVCAFDGRKCTPVRD